MSKSAADADPKQMTRSERLHRDSIVIDGSVIVRYDQAFLDEVKLGGVTAMNHTVTNYGRGTNAGLKKVVECHNWIDANKDRVSLILKAEDIVSAKKQGKFGLIMGPQDTDIIEDDIDLINVFWWLGIRIMQLTYQTKNLVGCGCAVEPDEGLSAFGRETVDRMNELGMIVDLSHVGPVTSREAIERSTKPVLFTHTHPRTLADHIRCKTDDLIKLLAARGGVMGITAYSPIFGTENARRPTIDDIVDHIAHVADLVGIDHVGLGLDHDETSNHGKYAAFATAHPELTRGFTWENRRAQGLDRFSMMPDVTSRLLSRGFSDDDVKKVLGLNFIRVFRENWG